MSNSGTIILIPTSGLANRLRIMAAAIKLSREGGKKLIIYWDTNFELNARFGDLFEFPANILVQPIPLKYKFWINMTRFSSKLFGFEKWYLSLFKFDFIFLDRMATDVWHNRLNLQNEVDKAQHIFICSCQEVKYYDVADYQLFKPVAAIQKKIDNLVHQFKPSIIGIHIRSTDHTTSMENSPFYLFENKIEEELNVNPEASFFLATDNKEYQNKLLKKFGREKIAFHKKEFRRDVDEGIKDAVVDLFCLSKTSKIYGSYFSSFSEVAGRIGQVPVHVLKKETAHAN
ncbi:MAG: hypothetical protein M3139_17090 [Bacteroidota bacterium]|nr:hypothetical protein [Bacteroidota bacterium]